MLAALLLTTVGACPDSRADAGVNLETERPRLSETLSVGKRTLRLVGLTDAFAVLDSNDCVLQLWKTATDRPRLAVTSRWRAPDGQLEYLVVESAPAFWTTPIVGESTVIGIDATKTWTALEAPTPGVFLVSRAGLPVLLGAGVPLVGSTSRRFTPLSLPKGPCTGTGLVGDQARFLHRSFEDDPRARVAFRELVRVQNHDLEVVGTEGDSLTVSVVVTRAKGACLQRQWEQSFGGNGATLSSPVVTVEQGGRSARLSVDAAFNFRPTSPDIEATTEVKKLEFRFDASSLEPVPED